MSIQRTRIPYKTHVSKILTDQYADFYKVELCGVARCWFFHLYEILTFSYFFTGNRTTQTYDLHTISILKKKTELCGSTVLINSNQPKFQTNTRIQYFQSKFPNRNSPLNPGNSYHLPFKPRHHPPPTMHLSPFPRGDPALARARSATGRARIDHHPRARFRGSRAVELSAAGARLQRCS